MPEGEEGRTADYIGGMAIAGRLLRSEGADAGQKGGATSGLNCLSSAPATNIATDLENDATSLTPPQARPPQSGLLA